MATKKRSRATLANVSYDASLRSSLVHLPIALYGPLSERGVPAQSIVVELVRADHEGNEVSPADSSDRIDKIYVGWSGMSAAPLTAESGAFSSSSSHSSVSSVVSMSPTLSNAFIPALQEGTSVRITLLRSPPLPCARRIDVVPLTADDWEILSLNADEVENNMLGQIRAARTGMIISVHVGRQGRTICRFRVESCDPPTLSYGNTPEEENESAATSTLWRAVRLSTDTEVVIAPRSRTSQSAILPEDAEQQVDFGANGTAASSQAHKSNGSAVETPLAAQHYLQSSPFRVLPSSTLKGSHVGVSLRPDDARIVSLAFAGGLVGEGRCAVTKMPSPAAPQVFSSAQFSSDSRASSTLHKGSASQPSETDNDGSTSQANGAGADAGASANSSAPAPRATTSTTFTAASDQQSSRWPSRHVVLSDDVRRKLGVRDFDLVRFSAPSPSVNGSTPTPTRPSSPELTDEESTAIAQKQSAASDSPQTLAGFDTILDTCTSSIQNAFRIRRWTAMLASLQSGRASDDCQLSTINAGLLLTGGAGSGKTSVVRLVSERLARESLVATIYVDCTSHAEERLTALRVLIDQWLAAAVWHSPTLLILDNVDRIIPADQEHVDSPRSVQIAEALMHRIRSVTAQHAVYVMATAQSTMSLNKVCLSSYHVFGETVELKAPSKDARREIIASLVAQRPHLHPQELNYATIAGQTEGYLPADLRDLFERAVHQSAIRMMMSLEKEQEKDADPRSLTMDDFEQAQKGFTPLSLRDIKLTQSATRWSDIGGLQETRRVLRETLEWPTKYAKVFAQCPLRLRSGLLLYGYPGCGKTLLAGAVARECGLNFISVKGPEILNKYIGASEKSVRDLFDRAQAAKPCVLFFDEFDSIAPKRGHDSTGVTDRVVNQLLTQMDGAEGLSGVYVLAATSRPDLIDSALLRPGRLDKSLLCDLPDEQDRLDILQVLCGSNRIRLAPDVSLEQWAKRTDGFSGADLQALVYNANLEAIHEKMNKKQDEQNSREDESKKEREQRQGKVRFVSFGGSKKDKSSTLSGAERQAIERRMQLILNNARAADQKTANSARLDALESERQTNADSSSEDKGVLVTEAQLQKCLRTTRQSVPKEEQVRLRKIYQQFVGERSGNFPNGEASQEVGARQSLM